MKLITIDAQELKAVRLFAAKEDIRRYLNGVCVQANDTTTRLIATDGSMLGVFETHFAQPGVDYVDVIIPTFVIDSIKPGSLYGDVVLAVDGDRYELRYAGTRVTFSPPEGKFPDYPRVFPEKLSGEPAHFDPKLIAVIDKAQKVFGKKVPIIWHNGTDNAVFQLQGADNFLGVIMPYRMTKPGETLPKPYLPQFRTRLEPTTAAAA
ncbi:DNA polymerase III subunit beta family protein [Burkholderia cenocepacia]|uniref:DNA polymerase III subunit beta family protein n=1 Tax=Burkholderia cenocepacia TaxID=95486 RepID=UPI002ABE6D25|nr:hypothetical protein [Burkholderia cenocepacia]